MKKAAFIKYLQSKDLSPRTIINHVKYTEQFFKKVKKEDIQVTKPDVLDYLKYLKNGRKLQNIYRSFHLTSLKHYFSFLCQEGQITVNPCWSLKIRGTKQKKLYKIYTPEELEQLFDNYWHFFVRNYDESSKYLTTTGKIMSRFAKERNALLLSVLINQGATTTEIKNIEINDLNLMKATIKIRGGRRLNDRVLPLKATQIGLFMNYIQNIRPQLLEYQTTENNKLFLSLPAIGKNKIENGTLLYSFISLSNQLKSIDKQFLNVLQVRASVITNWLKTEGLRKAQYMAGHRYVSSTEKFLPNNLDGLTDDINKLHPF